MHAPYISTGAQSAPHGGCSLQYLSIVVPRGWFFEAVLSAACHFMSHQVAEIQPATRFHLTTNSAEGIRVQPASQPHVGT
jgi:hypothetical protein